VTTLSGADYDVLPGNARPLVFAFQDRQERLPVYTPPITLSAYPPPPTFIGFVFSLSGWGLINATLVSQHAGLGAYPVPTLMATYLMYTSTKQLKLARQFQPEQAQAPTMRRRGSAAAGAAWALLPLMAGVLTGILILGGNALLLGLTAVIFTLAPWSRLAFCRDRIVVASVLMCVGIGLPWLIPHHSVGPIFLLIAAWCFWVCAIYAVLIRIAKLWQIERSLKSAERAALL